MKRGKCIGQIGTILVQLQLSSSPCMAFIAISCSNIPPKYAWEDCAIKFRLRIEGRAAREKYMGKNLDSQKDFLEKVRK